MLTLPEDKRHFFQQPFGTVYPDISTVIPQLSDKLVYSVGDVVTANLLAQGIVPDLAIVDGYAMRLPCDRPTGPFEHTYHTKNPPGTVTDTLIREIVSALSTPRSLIVVDGEEDLAVIPLVIHAPVGAALLYGQPKQGVVLRIIDSAAKKDAETLFAHFIPAVSC
jgi:uncharacterized protein (UPF0218 family)